MNRINVDTNTNTNTNENLMNTNTNENIDRFVRKQIQEFLNIHNLFMYSRGLFLPAINSLSNLFSKYEHQYHNQITSKTLFINVYNLFIKEMNMYIRPNPDRYDTSPSLFSPVTFGSNSKRTRNKDLTQTHIHTISYVKTKSNTFIRQNPNIHISFAHGNCGMTGGTYSLPNNVQIILLGRGGEGMHADTYGVYYEKMKNTRQINKIIKNPLYARRGEDYYWKDRVHILPGKQYRNCSLRYKDNDGWPMTILPITSINDKFGFNDIELHIFAHLYPIIPLTNVERKRTLSRIMQNFPLSVHQQFLNTLKKKWAPNDDGWTKMSNVINYISNSGGGTLFFYNCRNSTGFDDMLRINRNIHTENKENHTQHKLKQLGMIESNLTTNPIIIKKTHTGYEEVNMSSPGNKKILSKIILYHKINGKSVKIHADRSKIVYGNSNGDLHSFMMEGDEYFFTNSGEINDTNRLPSRQ
jgi:hypothetical protein